MSSCYLYGRIVIIFMKLCVCVLLYNIIIIIIVGHFLLLIAVYFIFVGHFFLAVTLVFWVALLPASPHGGVFNTALL